MDANSQKWWSFGKLCLIILMVSIAGGFLFYYWFGKEIHLLGKNLEIDFFNTVCGLFTIIGLGIAIFQIAEIRSEQQIIEETEFKVKTDFFRKENISRVDEVGHLVTELRDLINDSDYNEKSLNGFIAKIDRILDIFQKIDTQQVMLGCGTLVDCGKCVTLLEGIKEEFRGIVDKGDYRKARAIYFAALANKIRQEAAKCEIAIKKG